MSAAAETARRRDYLLELLTEEIPAGVIPATLATLAEEVSAALAAAHLGCERVEALATSRRLILVLRGLAATQPDREELRTGPPRAAAYDESGALTKAGLGFARGQGVAPEDVGVVQTPKGEYLGYQRKIAGRAAEELLPEILPPIFERLTFPRMMRWGKGERTFVRPVHGVVSLYGEREVPLAILGTTSGRRTEGHRTLAGGALEIASAESYAGQMRAAWVMVDGAERRRVLAARLDELAREAVPHGEPQRDEELLSIAANLVEWPGLVRGSFPERFLELPQEVLVTSMRTHQKSFPVLARGRIQPHFVAVMDNRDDPIGAIRLGNEWVLAARLADAEFFYRADRAHRLADLLPRLEQLAVHEELGDYRQKAGRLQELSEYLVHAAGQPAALDDVLAAAKLCKVDLVTEMVKEFTDLQGVVGGLYAREEGQPEGVWEAIYDHYLPRSVGDDGPRGIAGQIVSLADRIDALAGMFGIGLIPSGSRDPYGLRRQAMGAVRIVLDARLDLDIDGLVARAARLYDDALSEAPTAVVQTVGAFLRERLRFVLEKQGFAYDEIAAVAAVAGGNFLDARRRVAALHAMRGVPEFLALTLAVKRIRNIVATASDARPDPALFTHEAERALYTDFMQARGALGALIAAHDYLDALALASALAAPLDRFFAEVLVMDEDPRVRANRIALLSAVAREFATLAQFSELSS